MTQQAAEIREDQVLDVRGTLCPMPVIQASRTMAKLASGQVLKIVATDPGSRADIPAWAESTGHRLLRKEKENGLYTFWVQRV